MVIPAFLFSLVYNLFSSLFHRPTQTFVPGGISIQNHPLTSLSLPGPYNTFDGDGFPACNVVSTVYRPSTVDEIQSIVKDAVQDGVPVRASGVRPSLLRNASASDIKIERAHVVYVLPSLLYTAKLRMG